MKTLKYFAITALLISALSSCLVERPGGYGYGPRPHGHGHYHHGGYGGHY
jgi:hypothetical protein